MDLPESLSFDDAAVVKDWSERLQSFIDTTKSSDGESKADVKFVEAYGKEKKAAFCSGVAKAVAELSGGNKVVSVDLLVLCLRGICIVLRERGKELDPLLDVNFLRLLLTLAQDDTAADGKIQENCIKCLNNAFYQLDNVQKALIDSLKSAEEKKEENGFALLWKLLDCDIKNMAYVYNVLMILIAGTHGKEIPDDECVIATKKTIDNVATHVDRIATRKEGGDWLTLNLERSSVDERAIEAALKFVYSVGVSHEAVLAKLKAEDEQRDLKPEEIAKFVQELPIDKERNVPTLDRLGFLLVHLVMCKCASVEALRVVQQQAFCVLILSSGVEGYMNFLTQKGAVARLVAILDDTQIEQEKNREDVKKRVELNQLMLPLIIVLNSLAEHCEDARDVINEILFPYEIPEIDFSEMNEEQATAAMNQRKMLGTTPKDTPGGRLLTHMTAVDSHIKRFSSELVWNLSCGDTNAFVAKAGYGNAVHLIAIKGGMMGQVMAQQEKQQQKMREAMQEARARKGKQGPLPPPATDDKGDKTES